MSVRTQLLEKRMEERTKARNEKTKEVEKAENILKKHKSSMDDCNKEFPSTDVEDLIQNGKGIVQPTLDCYDRNFNQEEGEKHRLKRAARSCHIFKLFVLLEWDIALLELLIDDLANFERSDFT